jgi:membrane-bound ClpP family serine protease
MDVDADIDGGFEIGHFEGGHGDFTGGGISPLSLPILLVFGTAFGAFGTLFELWEWHIYLIPVVSAILSAGIAAVAFVFVLKVFIKTQADSGVKMTTMVGQPAQVTIPIKKDSTGQVLVITEERGRTLLSAISDEVIPTESSVIIKEVRGDTVVVEKK